MYKIFSKISSFFVMIKQLELLFFLWLSFSRARGFFTEFLIPLPLDIFNKIE